MEWLVTLLGLSAAAVLAAVLLWSIAVPARRLWPPERAMVLTGAASWLLALTIFGAALIAGLLDWNGLGLPPWLRWGVGLPLVILANLFVWIVALRMGMAQVSGADGRLITDGAYRYSRHPQYVADLLMLVGWSLLTASPHAALISMAGAVVLILATYAEEPWLAKRHGADYAAYRTRTPRFAGRLARAPGQRPGS